MTPTQRLKIKTTARAYRNEQELDDAIRLVSKEHPGKIITAYCRLAKVDIYIYDKQPATDTPGTIQTYDYYGGFIKDGKVTPPTKRWMDKHNSRPVTQ